MKFCPECGKDLKGSTKFCSECGYSLQSLISNEIQSETEIKSNSINVDDESTSEIWQESIQKTTRELGDNLEESVERIFKDRGYETSLRQRLRGKSGQLNEIDVLAKRNKITVAIECKNYDENRKIGIAEIRNFVAKLEDLDINRGFFITSSDFSSDAVGWAQNNPNEKQLELWDGSTFMEQFKATVLGRTNSKIVRIENCIEPKGNIDDFTNLTLHNADRVTLRRCDLIFHPFHIVTFNLNEEFKTPDKQIHTSHNSGSYFVDGLSGEIIYHQDDHGYVFETSDDEEKQFVKEIENYNPVGKLELTQKTGSQIIKVEPSIASNDAQFRVRIHASKDNQSRVPYEVRISKDTYESRDFLHKPDPNKIITKSRLVLVPKVDIEFESKEYSYSRIVFPASEIWVKDEIAKCKHLIGSKHTFAVCEICGIAKCEKDIMIDDNDICFCKKHASQDLKDKNKRSIIPDKLKKFSFRR
ncbi:MAG: restriction endonuclease [Nitrosarchaeum sp.]|nr:restriction endonuclease [Nitrosarchaeum sp.]